MRKISILLILMTISPRLALALADMKNANFTDYWLDYQTSENSLLKISRTYSSRSLFSGIFGFGWCSPLESKIDITSEGNLIFNECGFGPSHFFPANYNTQLINESVEKILTSLKKTNAPELREQLRNDHKLRSRYAAEAGIRFAPSKNTVYLMNGKELDRITFDGTYFVRALVDGNQQKFDSSGKLVYVSDRQKNFLRISYAGALPSQIIDNTNQKLTFSYTPEGKVRQITTPQSVLRYKQSGENLTHVTNAWQNAYNYAYDGNHNLTKIDFPDGSYKTISYVESKDWVKEFRDRDGCLEVYDFTLSQENPKDHYWSTAVKSCKGKTIYKNKYEFWYQMRPDREKYLSRVVTEKNNQILDVSYHQDFGKPLSVRKNADVTTYQYLNNGFLKQKTVSLFIPQGDETTKYSLAFDYDRDWKIEATTTEYFNKGGKVLRRKVTQFKYDASRRLILAKSADGQFVEIKYNSLGLISSIADQTKKEVLIEYDPKTQKPQTIARPSVGSLQLSYAANGDLKKVSNNGGSSTNTQIYSAFNNFIDMVGPVSAELSLNL